MASIEWIPTDHRRTYWWKIWPRQKRRHEKTQATQIAWIVISIASFDLARATDQENESIPSPAYLLPSTIVPIVSDPNYSPASADARDEANRALQAQLPLGRQGFQDPAAAALAISNGTWESHSAQITNYLGEAKSDLESQGSLALADVVASVYRAFPVIEQARLLARVTAGQQTSAFGAYDTKLEGYTLNQPVGFYQTYRQGIGAARQLWWGGYLSAGYRIGRGEFEPWYKERQTDRGGEFKVGLIQPLLQGRAIDPQRVEVFQSNLRRQAVGPEVQENILYASLEAANAYWTWVASGIVLRSQSQLLKLAEVRGEQLRQILKAGQAKGIDLVLNDQFIAERRLKVVESEQKFWQSASKLSLYLRDEAGQPLVPANDWLPSKFVSLDSLPEATLEEDFYAALSRRPELQLIDLQIQEVRWDLQLANNQLLPNIDFTMQNSKDVGEPASSLRDKTPYELEAGLVGAVPVQRRKARGKIEESIAKIETLQQKRRFQQDKIAIELQTAQSGLYAAIESIHQAEAAVAASRKALEIYREAYRLSQESLLTLNLVEPKVTENEIKLLEQQLKLFTSLAAKQVALGLDPLEQAMLIPSVPPKLVND